MATTIWLTDRSRYLADLDHCPRDRFLNYHAGPTGYGIARRAHSIPLSSGIYYHDALAGVLEHVRVHDALPPDPVVRAAIQVSLDRYRQTVLARGLQQLAEGERLEEVVAEQTCLIEGLVWAFTLTTLPWLLEHSRVVHVEPELLLVIGCTCGLGDHVGELEDHEGRDCGGVGYQTRPDFITEYRARPGTFAYHEFKGGAYADSPENWETKVQFAANAVAAGAKLEITIAEAWVCQLLKGRREGRDYDPATKGKTGPLIQNTTLCYWYRREGNPPLEAADWQEQYEWQDPDGRSRKLGNNYRKAGLWTLPEDMPEIAGSGISIPEFCAKFIPLERLGRHVQVLGPLQINQVLAHEYLEQVQHHEQRWAAICWELYDILTNEASGDWTSQPYQAALRRLVPQSWACRRYGRRYACQFEDVCFYREGWKDAFAEGNPQSDYVPRNPHHSFEREQMVARGIVLPEGLSDEQEEG